MSKEKDREWEEHTVAQEYDRQIKAWFTERELDLIFNSRVYAHNKPAGLPGHNLMIIIDKLCDFFGFQFPEDFGFRDEEE